MQILLACAKIMTGTAIRNIPDCTIPTFQREAYENAMQMACYSVDELMGILRCNRAIASENWHRYQQFFDEQTRQPAVFSYDGMVYQKFAPETMTDDELHYANKHIFIGSFLYGLLRPLDLVNRYRMEGNIVLPKHDTTQFNYWKPILTDWIIKQIKADDGILLNLASSEFKQLFDWRKIDKELTVITPEFKVEKDGKLKNVTIYAKMCRGAMARHVIKNQITSPQQLKAFKYEGFEYKDEWLYIL